MLLSVEERPLPSWVQNGMIVFPVRDKYTALLVFKRNYYVLRTILIFTVQQIGKCRFCILVGLNGVPV